ncbi:DUF3052 domain-containing protein [Candidatus Saccharibacteria bacterium]|nr:DUF3052 domain-containing protein [Candidatus Saccharibacteria bacterium]
MARYSDKSLVNKLGLKTDMTTMFLHAPDEYYEALGIPVQLSDVKQYEFMHAFFTDKSRMAKEAPILVRNLADKGMLWISWPKKSAQKIVPSDITEQDLRDIFLPLGVVDIKVCAVTDVWSGLKFTWRKK